MNAERTFFLRLRQKILHYLERNEVEKNDLYKLCEGADPRYINEALKQLESEGRIGKKDSIYHSLKITKRTKWGYARALTISNLYEKLPEENRYTSQWWFTPDTLLRISLKLWNLIPHKNIAFLGSPTLAYFYVSATDIPSLLLEVDKDVIDSIPPNQNLSIVEYDIRDNLKDIFKDKYDVIFLDPPWYPPYSNLFFYRAIEMGKEGASIVTSLPGLLTRPKESKAREELLNMIVDAGCNIVSIEQGILKYQIPSFERAAFERTIGVVEFPWRSADLLICVIPQKKKKIKLPTEEALPDFETYSRKGVKYRIFLQKKASSRNNKLIRLTPIAGFKKSISRREINFNNVDLWTSRNDGFKISNYRVTRKILKCWAKGFSSRETEKYLSANSLLSSKNSIRAVTCLKKYLKIWHEEETVSIILKHPKLEEEEKRRITKLIGTYPASPSERRYDKTQDIYRGEFQRDRDRLLWSNSFKKLSGKTQMLPWEGAAELRNRLSHTIEVTELASTFARVFKLNEDLTQAISFAHDIGHPPFGHSGEDAINEFFLNISNGAVTFNHYEQALDLINYIEIPYISENIGGYFGLDLHKEVQEGIFKHMYHKYKTNYASGKSQDEIYEKSKYRDILKNDFCHLEGQAVRLADKIAYLVEDLEDGIKTGILTINDLLQTSLFQHPTISISKKSESAHEIFVSQRRSILKLLMENTIDESMERIGKKDIMKIRNNSDYTISLPMILRKEMEEIWIKIQCGIIHKHERIVKANHLSGHIILFLLKSISLEPNIISLDFLTKYKKLHDDRQYEYIEWYEKRMSKKVEISLNGKDRIVDTWQVILAKDFIVALTDSSALALFRQLSGIV